jgi:hypothetical protein
MSAAHSECQQLPWHIQNVSTLKITSKSCECQIECQQHIQNVSNCLGTFRMSAAHSECQHIKDHL